MSTKRNPKKAKSAPKEEPKTAEELASEELDQVVGGSGPSNVAKPKLPNVSANPGAIEFKDGGPVTYKFWGPSKPGGK